MPCHDEISRCTSYTFLSKALLAPSLSYGINRRSDELSELLWIHLNGAHVIRRVKRPQTSWKALCNVRKVVHPERNGNIGIRARHEISSDLDHNRVR